MYPVTLADYLLFPLVKLLINVSVQLLRIYPELRFLLNIHIACQYIRYRQSVSLAVRFKRLVYVDLALLALYLPKVHFYLVIYMPPAEILPYIPTRPYSAFWCGSVKVVGAKKAQDSLLCACDVDTLTDGERLKVLRLHAGLTIRQAAEAVGICRHTLMNYESGRTAVKRKVYTKLQSCYHTLLSSIK